MAAILSRFSDPVTRDWMVNLILGIGLALVAGLSTYMLIHGR